MQDHCSPSAPYTIRYIKITWLSGCVVSGMGYGILILLAYSCFTALRKRKAGNPRVNRALMVYIVLTVILATIAEVMDIKVTIDGVLDDTCNSNNLQPPNPYKGPIDIVFLIINLLTDGLLVWRCYVVAKTFQGKAWSLMWLIPLLVYVGMIVTGIVIIFVFFRSSERGGLGDLLVLAQFGVSAFLNALITFSIATVIIQHRRMLSRTFGRDGALPYFNILTVVIESAALILIIDAFAIITIDLTPVGNIAFQLWIHSQPIASLMIIYRVSRNVDYFSNKETPTITPTTTVRFRTTAFTSSSDSGLELAERLK